MRAALVDPSAFTPPYDHSLAGALAAAGVDVELLTSRFLYGPTPEPAGYRVEESFYRRTTRLPLESRWRLAAKGAEHLPDMLAARRRLRAADVDVVHWQWLTLPRLDRFLIEAGIGPRRRRMGSTRRPQLLTLHYPLPPPGQDRQLSIQRSILSRFDAVISHTEQGAERLRSEVGLDPGRVHVIAHGPLDYLTRQRDERPLAAELAAVEAPVILFFGLLRPYKGVDTLLEAFARLGGGGTGGGMAPELWIAGMPRMDIAPLAALAARAPGRVRFIPRFISDPEIPALMRRADLLALPYREIEQSGVLYTGLAFGKPMVLGDVGGFGEFARRHDAAALVPPDDPAALAATLGRLLDDPAERERLAERTRAAVEGPCSWESIGTQTRSLYEELLGGRAR